MSHLTVMVTCMSLRFLHAADLHLDTPFEGISRANRELAERLRDASLAAFDNLVDCALARQVCFVVLAGDIYDGEERGVRAQLRFRRGLERLSEAGIPSFVVHGNHDPVAAGWSAVRGEWPDRVTVFGHTDVGSVDVEVAGEMVATVHGISYATREEPANLALRFRAGAGNGFQVGILHCNAGSNGDHAPYAPCTLDDLLAAGMDYWALGHIHARQTLRRGQPWVVYPGNTQGRSFKPSECGAKGAYLVEFDGREVAGLEFVPLDSVRFEHVVLDVTGIDDLPGLEQRLVEEAATVAGEAGDRAVVVEATLEGTGVVHGDLARAGAVDELLHVLRDQFEGGAGEVWWDRIQDRTRPVLDIETIRSRGDFSGELLALAGELEVDPVRVEQLLASRMPATLVPELSRLGIPNLSDPELVRRASLRALECLSGER